MNVLLAIMKRQRRRGDVEARRRMKIKPCKYVTKNTLEMRRWSGRYIKIRNEMSNFDIPRGAQTTLGALYKEDRAAKTNGGLRGGEIKTHSPHRQRGR